jgi:hypothetical protein
MRRIAAIILTLGLLAGGAAHAEPALTCGDASLQHRIVRIAQKGENGFKIVKFENDKTTAPRTGKKLTCHATIRDSEGFSHSNFEYGLTGDDFAYFVDDVPVSGSTWCKEHNC